MYARILVPIDGSATARKGLDEAMQREFATMCRASMRRHTDDAANYAAPTVSTDEE